LRLAPSQTNFLFFDCGGDSSALAASLLQAGIIVKAWREKGYERFLRVTIGSPAENDRLIEALGQLVSR
jgi:histidinol-phosphate aminotransferase